MSSSSGFADTLSPGTTTTTTNANPRSTSTVRSRRLVSFTDSDEDNNLRQPRSTGLSTMLTPELPAVRSRGATPSPRPSRTLSPIPMSHPSRVTQTPNHVRTGGNSLGGFYLDGKNQVAFAESSRAAADFLDASWSSLQSLASSLLGSDITHPTANGSPRTHARKPSRPDVCTRIPSRTPSASTWGPSAPAAPEIGAGTKEERQALVQAKKREALLLAETDPSWSLNARHKRRDSSDQADHSAIQPDQDGDALVYVHRVQPADSITGVTIRYGCQPAIFRKANGFWPTDSIQGRKTVLLPVDCCSVKGRPVNPHGEVDLLDDVPRRPSIEDMSGSSIAPTAVPETPTLSADQMQTKPEPAVESDHIWTHESWVQIDGFSAPVEIGRIPRTALGFFPRSRRKSLCYSDSEPFGRDHKQTIHSSSSSPIQLLPSRYSNDSQPQSQHASNPRTSRLPKPGVRHKRQRSGLQLSGTGVGTLDGSVNLPGPAMDGLSKFVAEHLPQLAPTQPAPNFDSLNENSSTAASNSTSLDSIGGAVEGWVRKMTARAKSSLSDLQQGTSTLQGHGRGQTSERRGLGDLIELDDGVESRASTSLLVESSWNADFNRSGTNLSNGGRFRGRFPSASPSTSRTRTGLDRVKDD
ncbi:hypothetical protein P175DRAFT_0533255 [Aspergillus ochraceoroseus IBT 24754]|uniref:LysM domain-containing protein n=3 Tax=Aspergillus subgen. Nidulantes TaxID=2720870 RepID=A0A0F8UQZ4_9EURO|nr:uncharacterized protein P175DRAFT_0533255 [Aspergillus ochraceoroseus IBT 24754]KKK21903.1 hypothetical protein ARAM_004739 [Aspergillus rambellii]KKK23924.1 hypothetical protein AOCH_002610 [Aspergillus ochraceoroseus]PTU20263.1 hypothetical protein P175DRAFT_0533255 [Aspergillus ochraceoroseus IBT 24754]